MVRRYAIAALVLLCFSFVSFADDLATDLKAIRTSMKLSQGKLTGAGADFLVRESSTGQFVLVGEDHGIKETGQFCQILFKELQNSGFRHLAIETGPLTAARLEKMGWEQSPMDAIRNFDQKYSFSIPIYNWEDDYSLLVSIVRANQIQNGVLWGLDQEFILSPTFHLQRLVEIAPNDSAKKVAQEYLEKSQKDDQMIVTDHNPTVAFMVSATEQDFQRLQAAFQPKPASEADRILFELHESWEIYAKNFQNKGYDSNLQRSQLMKKHFHQYYDRLSAGVHQVKVLFKLGAYHCMRGRTVTGVHDIGNHVSELAEANGSHSFHILILTVKGTVNSYRPFTANPADKTATYDLVKELDTIDAKPLIAAAQDATDWSVFDLRQIRQKLAANKFGTLDPGLVQALWGYDALVMVPEGHAATLINN